MNEYEDLLSIYGDLLERSSRLIDEEVELLKVGEDSVESLHEEKRILIVEMDQALHRLKGLNSTSSGVPSELKEAFDSLQHKFMKVIKMDRTLEKTYLEKQRESRRVNLGNSVDRAGAKRLYGL